MPPGPRRRDWLLGRAALKRLLGAATDTSLLAFPHPRLSLTHAGGRAFAAQALGSDVVGTGVDYEPHRSSADPRAARFFLRPAERAHASGTDGLLRLWTVKEALFKATPDNAEAVLLDYELTNPGSPSGEATGPRGEQMRYLTVDTGGGLLTVAVCLATPGERRRAAV